jgi:metal-responsive CopG/Arc/MetJ family transcriptional regulator
MAEEKEKSQINFQISADEVATVDRIAKEDGFDNRSAWVRRLIRQEIARRQQGAVVVVEHPSAVQLILPE